MGDTKLFSTDKTNKLLKWEEGVRTWFVRSQYNEMLQQVITKDAAFLSNKSGGTPFKTSSNSLPPNYYNSNLCLALNQCYLTVPPIQTPTEPAPPEVNKGGKFAANPSRELCLDAHLDKSRLLPMFNYVRSSSLIEVLNANGISDKKLFSDLDLKNQLPFGSVLWLYYYERMGIFKILGALMDDYNYKGKFTISSKSEVNLTFNSEAQYSELMDTICTMYRIGIGSNLRDRIALYQRVLGVSIENNLNVETEKNEPFMRNFNKLISYSLDFFQNKQLAQAIRDTNNQSFRSSVATQTAIRDTILVLQKNFEAFEYGRNRMNTFLGISMVYATICLLRMLKDEIGVPRQFNDPDEFIPAAYDILVSKKALTSNETNRFTVYDNCASYGFKLLTDIELIDANNLSTISIGSELDAWLNNSEGDFEGYNNAFKSIQEPVGAMV
jgi:hypothetical protein